MRSRPKFSLRRFVEDRDGVSAVEFALLAPVIIALYLGMAELSQGFLAQRRVDHVAATLADLTTQNTAVNDTVLGNIFTAGEMTLSPFPTTALQQRISSVTVDTKGVAKVDWSVGRNVTALTKGTVVTLPANLASKGQTVVWGEAVYDYRSTVQLFLTGSIRLKQSYYLRPRLTDQIPKT